MMRTKHQCKRWSAIVLASLLLMSMVWLPISAETVKTYIKPDNDRLGGQYLILDDCDDADGWIASVPDVTLDEDEATEGFGSVAVTTSIEAYSNSSLDIRGTFDVQDLSNYDLITFDIYISDVALIESSYQVTAALASGGVASEAQYTWPAAMMTVTYEEGWNHIELPLTSGTSSGIDFSRVDTLRLLFRRISPSEDLEDIVVRIDDICAESYGTKAVMLLSCDSADGWNGDDSILDYENHTEGYASVSFRATTLDSEEGDHNMVKQCVFSKPVDARNADYLELDLYVSDAAALRESSSKYGLHIEITSSGTCDHEEYQFRSENFEDSLKDGWNHLRLPISSAGISDGECDLRRVNYFRIHLLDLAQAKNNELIVKIDNVYLSVIQDGIDDYAQPEQQVPSTESPEEQTPQIETPTDDNPGDSSNVTSDETVLRKAKTTQRARILFLVFAFVIIAVDIITVAMKRKLALETDTTLSDLQAAQEQDADPKDDSQT